jgi:transposase InsO family protein
VNIRLHANATTTPKTRRYIQESTKPVAQLARELKVTEDTIRRWKKRETVSDGSHTPHHLKTTLTPAQEAVVVELRKTLRLSLDDLLVVTREFINAAASRSGVDRCLRRHGLSNLKALLPEEREHVPAKRFKDYAPGFVHIDIKYLPQMPDEAHRRYLFVAIDRASRWVYVELRSSKSAQAAEAFLKAVHATAPFTIETILTDNDKAFTDRFSATGERTPSGAHRFDQGCAARAIEHRLITPYRPQTNGMVERFNGRIADVLRTNRFDSSACLEATLRRFVHLYNHHIPQKRLHYKTPVQTLKEWQSRAPQRFHKPVRNLPGPDS